MNNLNVINQENQQSEEIASIQCNRCGLIVEMLSTQESCYQSDYMHQFNPTFNFCGQDTSIDMQTCEFVLCQKCLFDLFETFVVKTKLEDDTSWLIED